SSILNLQDSAESKNVPTDRNLSAGTALDIEGAGGVIIYANKCEITRRIANKGNCARTSANWRNSRMHLRNIALNCRTTDGKMCVVGLRCFAAMASTTAPYSPAARRHLALRG